MSQHWIKTIKCKWRICQTTACEWQNSRIIGHISLSVDKINASPVLIHSEHFLGGVSSVSGYPRWGSDHIRTVWALWNSSCITPGWTDRGRSRASSQKEFVCFVSFLSGSPTELCEYFMRKGERSATFFDLEDRNSLLKITFRCHQSFLPVMLSQAA